MFASLSSKLWNYQMISLCFDIEKNIIIEAFDRFASISMPLMPHITLFPEEPLLFLNMSTPQGPVLHPDFYTLRTHMLLREVSITEA
jgi:hypothetical protein